MAMVTHTLRGKAYWAMILKDPRFDYGGDPRDRQWTIDLQLDKAGVKAAKDLDLETRVKKDKDHSPFIKFIRREIKNARGADGTDVYNKPIKVVDVNGKPWDEEELIGNESVVDIEFSTYVPEFKGKKYPPKPNILKVTVVKHVPYVSPASRDETAVNVPAEEWATA